MPIQVSSGKVDRTLLVITLILVAIGMIMVFSSSTNISMERYGNGTFYFRKHAIRVIIGLAVMFTAMNVDYRLLKKLAGPLLVISILLLVFTKLQYLVEGNRMTARWLHLGPVAFQTSDLARFALITYLAAYLDKKGNQIQDFTYGFLPPVIVTALIMALVIVQPDFSTAVMIGLVAGTLLFMGRAKIPHLLAAGSLGAAVLIPTLLTAEYRLARLKAFINFGTLAGEANYQVQQSLISLGHGGITGVGLGGSVGKNLFLPTPHTDFIASIIGEEFGFLGIFITLTLYLALFQRSVRISRNCTQVFGILLSMGLSLQIVAYSFINVAVVSSIIPTTGLPMPFVSFGGSSLVVNLMAVGILLNISKAKRTVQKTKAAKVLYGW
ncbi:MAG: FtsW/RodA/SpoVE family cell cycle protein [Fidelibacterota bacterium]